MSTIEQPTPAACTCPGTRDLVLAAIGGNLPPCAVHRPAQTGAPVPGIPLNDDAGLAARIGAAISRGRGQL